MLKHDDIFEILLSHITRKLRSLSARGASAANKAEIASYHELINFKDLNGDKRMKY